MEQEDIKIMHHYTRDDQNRPIEAFSATVVEDQVFVGASRVSTHDQFNYRKGKAIANGRMKCLLSGKQPTQMAGVFPIPADMTAFLQSLSIQSNGQIFTVVADTSA
jgi:hypothetical protein